MKQMENQDQMQVNEHIRGLISQDFTFSKRCMFGTLTIGSNTFQVQCVPSANGCQCMPRCSGAC